jgi:hypothetical protein
MSINIGGKTNIATKDVGDTLRLFTQFSIDEFRDYLKEKKVDGFFDVKTRIRKRNFRQYQEHIAAAFPDKWYFMPPTPSAAKRLRSEPSRVNIVTYVDTNVDRHHSSCREKSGFFAGEVVYYNPMCLECIEEESR